MLVGCGLSAGTPPFGWPARLRGGRTTRLTAKRPVTELSAPPDFTLRTREARIHFFRGEAS